MGMKANFACALRAVFVHYTLACQPELNHLVKWSIIEWIINSMIFRRRHQRNDETRNYMSLPSDEEDDDLLDAASDNEDNDDDARLSLISSASDDNLLRNEEPC